MKSILRTIATVCCILLIAISAFLILQKVVKRAGVDLTDRKMYTLSDGTKKILSEMKEPVALKLYYSRTIANKGPEGIRRWNTYFLFVRDMLQEYAALSGGKVSVEVIDPRMWSDAEEEAVRSGLTGMPVSFTPDEDNRFFFGLTAQTGSGRSAAIPFLSMDREEFLEYDVSRLITRIEDHTKKRIGILSSLPVLGDAGGVSAAERRPPWLIAQDLGQEGEVVRVPEDADAIDQTLDVLVVIYPVKLPDETLFAVDQFVMKGGRLVVFVDPYCPTATSPANALSGFLSLGFNKLLRGWGVEMEEGAVVVDRVLGVRESGKQVVGLPLLTSQCMNPGEIVSAQLHDVSMYYPGRLKDVPGAGTQVIPLMTTLPPGDAKAPAGAVWKPSDPTVLISDARSQLRGPDPDVVLKAVQNLPAEQAMLACRIAGRLKTNYPDGPPARKGVKPRTAAEQTAVVKETAGDTSVIVFADVDMLWNSNAYIQAPFGLQATNNVTALLNSIDYLGGKPELISIRSRGRFSRPFTRLEEMESKAQEAIKPRQEELEKKRDALMQKLQSPKAGKLPDAAQIAERRKAERELYATLKTLRTLYREKVKGSEDLEAALQFHNLFWAPVSVLIIAGGLLVYRRAGRFARRKERR